MKLVFNSPSCGKMSIPEVIEEIARYIGEDKHVSYGLVIGTDSQEKRLNGDREVEFVTARYTPPRSWREIFLDKIR